MQLDAVTILIHSTVGSTGTVLGGSTWLTWSTWFSCSWFPENQGKARETTFSARTMRMESQKSSISFTWAATFRCDQTSRECRTKIWNHFYNVFDFVRSSPIVVVDQFAESATRIVSSQKKAHNCHSCILPPCLVWRRVIIVWRWGNFHNPPALLGQSSPWLLPAGWWFLRWPI